MLGMSADYMMSIGCYGDSGWHEERGTYREGWVEEPYNGTWWHTQDTGRCAI